MISNLPLDIQWFIYALICNDQITEDYAVELYSSLGNTGDLTDFAQVILDQMSSQLGSDEEQQVLLEQMQQLMEYAVNQAETGLAPDFPEPVQAEEYSGSADNCSASTGTPAGQSFEAIDMDLSGVQGYENLPSLSDTAMLDDDQLAERMIMLLTCLRHLKCSDLHISGGAPPFVRRKLLIERIDSYILTPEDSRRLNNSLLNLEQREYFKEHQDMNFALEVGNDRFRVCLMEQKTGVSGSYRLVPDHLCSLEELGFLPNDIPTIKKLLDYNNGLILVTGPIGSGKTTTLASMIDIVNSKRNDHVISVEDPIEILQMSKGCQISQREVGRHTKNYHSALKAALREDPDVIVIGEMHDLETIENAITAAETGHLVIGTLHTSNAPSTLNRLLDVFAPAQQPQIRAMTAGSLRGIICQKLIPDGMGGLIMIYELLLNSMAIGNLINEGKTFQIGSTMMLANKQGMCTFDQCTLAMYEQEKITRDMALQYMTDATTIRQLNSLWAQREAKKAAAAKKR